MRRDDPRLDMDLHIYASILGFGAIFLQRNNGPYSNGHHHFYELETMTVLLMLIWTVVRNVIRMYKLQ